MRGSRDRVTKLETEIAQIETRSAELTSRWSAEKQKLQVTSKSKEELEKLQTEYEQAVRQGNLARASELKETGAFRSWKSRSLNLRKATAQAWSKKLSTLKPSRALSRAGLVCRSRKCSKARRLSS